MVDWLIQNFNALPDFLSVIILSSIPIAESRVAVPLAIVHYHMSPFSAILFSSLGAIIPTWLLLNFLGPVADFLSRKFEVFKKFFTWLFARTHRQFIGQYEKYGLLALFIFVAVPIPGSGVWAGAVASFLFGIDRKKSFVAIILGAVAACIIVTMITLGVFGAGLVVDFLIKK